MIRAENLGLYFKQSRFRKSTIKSALASLVGAGQKTDMNTHFWALRDINFCLEKGEILGVIGRNGAGKSTLLRTIGGIYQPDEGLVKVEGTVSTLLALGTGFKPELSGYENIYLNGVTMGFSKNEIEKQVEAIVEFSELGDFMYEPVKNYSSGMGARLGFSTSLHLKRDVMLIDEILGVGDFNFKKKSQDKLLEVINEGRTVVIVSHSLESIKKYCTKVLWINKGQMMEFGKPDEVVANYLNSNN